MEIYKITTGYVLQIFDTELNRFVSQKFVAAPLPRWLPPQFENDMNETVDSDTIPDYLPFDMVQPEVV